MVFIFQDMLVCQVRQTSTMPKNKKFIYVLLILIIKTQYNINYNCVTQSHIPKYVRVSIF